MNFKTSLVLPLAMLAGTSAVAACSGGAGASASSESTATQSSALSTVSYYGGPVIPNVKVVQVNWNGNIDPTISNGMGGFYTALTRSELWEWLDGDYATTINANAGSHLGQAGTNQRIGYGSFAGSFNLNQPVPPMGQSIPDSAVQNALKSAFGTTLPAPDANTVYMIQFPPHSSISDPNGALSCAPKSFCGYHWTLNYLGQAVKYGVLPDTTIDCATCGQGDTSFNKGTYVAGHELIETVTDPNYGFITPNPPVDYPAAWFPEIVDQCTFEDHIAAPQPDGSHYAVEQVYSSGAGCIVSKPSGPPPGASVAAYNQTSATTDVAFVAQDGSIQAKFDSGGSNTWVARGNLTGPGFAPPGAPLATGVQNGNQVDVFLVGNDGAIYSAYFANNAWNGPLPLTATGVAPGRANLAAAVHPGANQLDVFFVNGNGAVSAIWAVGTGGWNGPITLTPNNAAPAGGLVATGMQNSNQLDVVYVGQNQAIDAVWVDNTPSGPSPWFGPVALSPTNLAPPGAPIATGLQGTQFDVFTVGWSGNVEAVWVLPTDNTWRGPLAISTGGLPGRGSNLATAQQNSNQLDLFYVDSNGRLTGQGVQGQGFWSAPIGLSSNGFCMANAPLAAALASPTQLDVFVACGTGLNFTYERNNGTFQTPVVIYPH